MDTSVAHPAPLSALTLTEWILKDRKTLEDRVLDPDGPRALAGRALGIALVGFTLFGVVLAVAFELAPAGITLLGPIRFRDGSALRLLLAYDLGLIAAAGLCLPSFYFYGLLGGVMATMAEVATQALLCLAVTAVVLVGLLPLYLSLALGAILFGCPPDAMRWVLAVGCLLPFFAGLWGLGSLRGAFLRLAHARPPAAGIVRPVFLCRMLQAWGLVYVAVSPLVIWTLWRQLGG